MDKEKYGKIIKEFEELINGYHICKVENVRIEGNFVIADICLINLHPIKGDDNWNFSNYKNCKYIRSELESELIFDRRYKSRLDEF